MLNKTENELSGVVSTAMSFLGLYRDPFIARNTSVSDFAIHDLMNSEHPVSLFLVVPPSDIERTKPLMRLMLNQFGRRLTEKIAFTNDRQQYRHRLLMMLDEFPSLGRLGFFESELAYMAGYGIKCVMIAQSLNQIEMAYGPNNSILDNSHVRITYGALDERTAKRISDLLGQATEKKLQMNFAGNRLSPWLGHIMESEQESPRPLLTPGEILQLPGDDALVMIGGLPPYRAKKIMYYQDERLTKRAWLPTPDDPEAQQSELLSEDCRHNPWLADSAVAGQEVAEHKERSNSELTKSEKTGIAAEAQHDAAGENSVESAVPENTLLVEEPEITRTIDRTNNRAGIIELSRTPQGGHLPL
jgi:type IV secretion system protein VirD4